MSKPKMVKIRVVRMGLRVRSSLRAGDTPSSQEKWELYGHILLK